MLNLTLYYVNGNHVQGAESEENAERNEHPWGAVNLHRKVVYDHEHDLILAGIEGSLRYNDGSHQYTQTEMWRMVLGLAPQLASNRVKYGRYLDIFVSHASATGIQDDIDKAHQGIDAFRWLLATFKPRFHLHGHMHHYNPLRPNLTRFGETQVINTYGYREIVI
jgi:Icc-related predicted phosphoesterase